MNKSARRQHLVELLYAIRAQNELNM